MNFFEWLEKQSPGYEKRVFENFDQAMTGKMYNSFQWRATEKALDTQFAKAPQEIHQKNTNTTYVIKRDGDGSEPLQTPPVPAEDSGLSEEV